MPSLKLPRLRRRQSTQQSIQPAPPPQDNGFDPDDGHGARMGFFEHLDELRTRLFRAALGLVLGTAVGVALAAPALDYLRTPYCRVVAFNEAARRGEDVDLNELQNSDVDCQYVNLGPTGSVVAYFRVALMVGAGFAMPLIVYQLLMFIFPGLTRREKRIVLMSLPAISLLFVVGVVFTWFVLMPPALGFLEGFQQNLFRSEWTADLYLSFVTSLIFWMGVAFETPLVFFVLGLLGLVSTVALIRNWRFAIIGAAIAAAVITPTIDPVNMLLVMAPLLALYALSILLVYISRRISRLEEPAV